MALFAVKALSKVYPASGATTPAHRALNGVTFDVQQGDIYGLIGSSGAGKSTLMHCFLGVECPSAGEILFHGQNISMMSPADLRCYRRKIGMVFQHFNLFSSRTVAQNISYPMEIAGVPAAERQRRCDELLELVGLPHKGHFYPSSLSGGEKQRVGIARALANHPEVLFCDEATSALDPPTMKGILSLLYELNRKLGLTMIVITHQFDVVKQICNKIGVLMDGELIEEGAVAELFTNPKHPATRRLIGSQLPELPQGVIDAAPTKSLYRLSFQAPQAKEPIISRLLKRFDVEVNILQANLDSFQQAIFGVLIVELIGAPDQRARAIAYLRENHVQCEEIS